MAIKTQIIKIDPALAESDKVKNIARVLQEEGIIAYPTDTFYGLGASCFSKKAIQRIYNLKKREPLKPISIIISDINIVREIAKDIPTLFWKMAGEFWPGPLTLVLRASSALPRDLLGPRDSIGVRQTALAWIGGLLEETGFPITATSANVSGEKEISNPEIIRDSFFGLIDLIVDGGETRGALPSTVVDLTAAKPVILREGVVPRSDLVRYLE
ncbi:MAG: threonylcarbamoyl-AMP synthase [Candidatus Aminicenantes bacterium]|nr:threonylcarbamoyl-AMP synthase [Candidatus Aminicenantes bacterium]